MAKIGPWKEKQHTLHQNLVDSRLQTINGEINIDATRITELFSNKPRLAKTLIDFK